MNLPITMSGVVLTGHGGPEKLEYRTDLPVPAPGPGEVLVRVLAAGVNNTDINTRIGWYDSAVTGATDSGDVGETGGWNGAIAFPRIQGGDLCGRVIALGDDVAPEWEGKRIVVQNCQPIPTAANPVALRVIGSDYDGGFAEYCMVPANQLFDVTDATLSDIELAAMPCAFGTAEGLLARAGVNPSDRVLITGASGGVGMAAVKLAKLRGAHVTAVTSPAKADAVREAGADTVLGRDETASENYLTAVIDVVGGDATPDLLKALRPGGRYAVAGAIAGPLVTMDLRDIYLKDLTLFGCTFQSRATFQGLVDHINAGRIRPLISNTYPLADIATAQDDFQSKRYPGKLVLVPPSETS